MAFSIIEQSHDLFGTIRKVDINGEPYLVLRELTDYLGMRNTGDLIKKIELRNQILENQGIAKCYGLIREKLPDRNGRMQTYVLVDKAASMFVFSRSNRPEAVLFQAWIDLEVIPSMLSHGVAMTQQAALESVHNKEAFGERVNAAAAAALRISELETLAAEQAELLEDQELRLFEAELERIVQERRGHDPDTGEPIDIRPLTVLPLDEGLSFIASRAGRSYFVTEFADWVSDRFREKAQRATQLARLQYKFSPYRAPDHYMPKEEHRW